MLFLNLLLLLVPTILNIVVVLSVHQTHSVNVNDNLNDVHTIPLGSEATFHWRYNSKIIFYLYYGHVF